MSQKSEIIPSLGLNDQQIEEAEKSNENNSKESEHYLTFPYQFR